MNRSIIYFAFATSLFGAACATPPAADETTDSTDDALTDFGGQAGIVEGSSEAAAVRAVVNNPNLRTNDYVTTIGLASATVDAILTKRPFTSLAQLDALPQASAAMFVKLQTFARNTGVQGLVHGSNRTIPFQGNSQDVELEQWGRGLWEGFVTYSVSIGRDDQYVSAHLVDASGATYALTTTPTRYERLPLPVRLIGKSYTNSYAVSITDVAFEVLRTNPIAAQALVGKYQGTASSSLMVIGSDIPGVQMKLTATAGFFLNFTNGDSCDTLQIIGADQAVHTLKPQSPADDVTATAPLAITAQSTCISSRLPEGQTENASSDFNLQISAITLGSPQ